MRILSVCLLVSLSVACSGSADDAPDAGGGRKCVGGVIIDGVCHAKCDPSKCLPGNTCVDNQCALICDAHSDCSERVQECQPAVEDDTGAAIFTCQEVTPVDYDYGAPCPNGYECPVCKHNGPGDAKAYCSLDCAADADCPGGYECAPVMTSRDICGTPKGYDGVCGSSIEPCVERSEITPGSGLSEGSFCLYKSICQKRDVCSPCETDVDCSWSGTKCTELETGEKVCAAECATDSDCSADKSCGGVGRCLPRYGDCKGQGTFCHPCRMDSDCAENHLCAKVHGDEYACIDVTYPVNCSSDDQCPLSPSGKRGSCMPSGGRGFCYFPTHIETFSCY